MPIAHGVALAGARSLYEWRFGCYLHRLVSGCDRQRKLEVHLGAYRDLHILIQRAESAMAGLDLVTSDRQQRKRKQSVRIGGDAEGFTGLSVGGGYFAASEHRARRIAGCAGECALAALRECARAQREEHDKAGKQLSDVVDAGTAFAGWGEHIFRLLTVE